MHLTNFVLQNRNELKQSRCRLVYYERVKNKKVYTKITGEKAGVLTKDCDNVFNHHF